MRPLRLKDRVCLVTGGGSGIGEATALQMAREGARVGVLSRTREEVERVADRIVEEGGEAIALCADIASAEELRDAIDTLVERWGRLDVLFANAGINGVWAPIDELSEEEWDRTIDINLKGTFLSVKYAVPHLRENGGSIIITASINGTRVFSNSGATAYACSKAAQVAMTKMLAMELAADRIRVNVICPGAIDTDIGENTDQQGTEQLGVPVEFPEGWHPLRGRPGTSEEVASVAVFLASDEAAHVTGTEMWIDGGESLIGLRG